MTVRVSWLSVEVRFQLQAYILLTGFSFAAINIPANITPLFLSTFKRYAGALSFFANLKITSPLSALAGAFNLSLIICEIGVSGAIIVPTLNTIVFVFVPVSDGDVISLNYTTNFPGFVEKLIG